MLRTRDGNVITKHDEDLNGRMNALDMAGRMDHAGDLGDGDFRIPNRVFNQLKHDMKKGESFKGLAARGRVEHATRATQDGVLDPRTRLLLFKMLNKGLFSEVRGRWGV
jgi:RIO kinase 1